MIRNAIRVQCFKGDCGIAHKERSTRHEGLDIRIGVGLGSKTLLRLSDEAGDSSRVFKFYSNQKKEKIIDFRVGLLT